MSDAYRPIPMRKGKPVVLVVLAIIAFGCIMGFVVAWRIKATIRAVPAPIPSPDGTLMAGLTVDEEQTHTKSYMRLGVEIRDAKTNALVFRRQTTASAMRDYGLKWSGNDEVALDSSEVGFELRWKRDPSGWTDVPKNGEYVVPPVAPTTEPATQKAKE